MPYIAGTMVILLFFMAMPLKYFAEDDTMVAIVGPVHGFLYVLYLAVAFDVARRHVWALKQTLGVLIAVTIPVLSLFAELWGVRKVTPKQAAEAA